LVRRIKKLHDPSSMLSLRFREAYFIAGGEVGHPGEIGFGRTIHADDQAGPSPRLHGEFSNIRRYCSSGVISMNWAEVKVLKVKKMFQQGI